MNITDTDFWKIVEIINWNESKNYKKHSNRLNNYFNREDLDSLRNKSKQMQAILSIKIRNINTGLGDDGYWDLTSHIVGLGYNVYQSIIENPEKILDYKNTVFENFDYCFNVFTPIANSCEKNSTNN